MISLEQIRVLEQKVQAAVSRIRALSGENSTLKERLGEYERRVAELETLVSSFKAEQDEIEAGIVAALRQLDDLEHTVGEPEKASGEPHSKAAAATNRTEPQTKSIPGHDSNATDAPPAEAPAASPPVESAPSIEEPASDTAGSGEDDATHGEESDEPSVTESSIDDDSSDDDDGDDEDPELDIF